MRIKNSPPQTEPTHSRGLLVWRYRQDGSVVVQKWPKKRPGPMPAITQEQTAIWDMAQEWVKTPLPEDYRIALADTEGTAFYARDILISSMYGNYVSWPGYGWRFKMAQNIQALLDTICTTTGAILVRTADAWECLLPADADYVLTSSGPGAPPSYQPVPIPPAAARALYSGAMDDLPTLSNTGLTTWLNQGSATANDRSTGITIAAPSNVGDSIRARYKPAPSTPYSIKALVGLAPPTRAANNYTAAGIGWYDGNTKLHLMLLYYDPTGGLRVQVSPWNSVTSQSTNQWNTPIAINPCWLRIKDDGTTIYFETSASGDDNDFITLYSVAKASSWLGPSGYSNVLFCADKVGTDANLPALGTLHAWQQGT